MAEGTESRKLTTVKCETHGLRYNPNVHSGCVRCRKEAGEKIGTASFVPSGGSRGGDFVPSGGSRGGDFVPSGGSGGGDLAQPAAAPARMAAGAIPGVRSQDRMLPALAVTLILVVLTGGSFFWVHKQFYEAAAESMGFDPAMGLVVGEEMDEATGEEALEEILESLSRPEEPDTEDGELSDEDGKVIGR